MARIKIELEVDVDTTGIDSRGDLHWAVIKTIKKNIENGTWDVLDNWPILSIGELDV